MIARRLLGVLVLVAGSALPAWAQVSPAPGVQINDEAVSQGRATILNCTGAGIACSVTGTTATLNATGGSGSANTVEVSIDLGTTGGLTFSVTVTGQSWVAADSEIVCSPFATVADGQTVETYVAAGFAVNAATRVVSTGFDLWLYNPHGATGIFRVHCTGA